MCAEIYRNEVYDNPPVNYCVIPTGNLRNAVQSGVLILASHAVKTNYQPLGVIGEHQARVPMCALCDRVPGIVDPVS